MAALPTGSLNTEGELITTSYMKSSTETFESGVCCLGGVPAAWVTNASVPTDPHPHQIAPWHRAGEGQLSRDTQRQRDSRRDSEAQPRKGGKKRGRKREKREKETQ